ncbi:MAG: 50S ribosomal protein L25 [Brevinemataceae bacterium]
MAKEWSTTTLKAEIRTASTKSSNKSLRAESKLPAVIYGPKIQENINITIDYISFEKVFAANERHQTFTLESDSKKYNVIIKDYKIDPISRRFMHVDFYAVEKGNAFKTLIPIQFTGTPVGVREGGNLLTYLRKIYIHAKPEDMPAQITIDISNLQRKRNIIVRDIEVPKNCKILTNKGVVLTEVK